ncbi:hypothetical protein BJ742DRAFT_769643 [Cladochytrium replicatum]|nr:hypothetical protein BJ742DRAFT_769643 [Cladochytrium replicatum]
MDQASANGSVDALDRWKSSGLTLEYTGKASVLDWWKNGRGSSIKKKGQSIEEESNNLGASRLYLKWLPAPLDQGSSHGNVLVLQWLDSGLNLKRSELPSGGLEWWKWRKNWLILLQDYITLRKTVSKSMVDSKYSKYRQK